MIHEQGDMIGEISPASVAPKLFTEPPVFVHPRPTTRSWSSLSLLLHKMSLLGSVCVEFKVRSSRLGVCWTFLGTLHPTATKGKLNLGGPFSPHVLINTSLHPETCIWRGPPNWTLSIVCSLHVPDSIEANVENAESHVQSGTQQLARAADYQVRIWQRETMEWWGKFQFEKLRVYFQIGFKWSNISQNSTFFLLQCNVDVYYMAIPEIEKPVKKRELVSLSDLDCLVFNTLPNMSNKASTSAVSEAEVKMYGNVNITFL